MPPGRGAAGSKGSPSGEPRRCPGSQGPAGSGKRMLTRVRKRQHLIPRVRGNWLPEEDEKLRRLVESEGEQKWSLIAQQFPGRIGKQCRERWHYQLRPDISWEAWTDAEELKFIACHRKLGNKWAFIAREMEGRTENAIKNHWNATLRRMDAEKGPTTKLRDYMRSLDILPQRRKYKTHGIVPCSPGTQKRSPCSTPGPRPAERAPCKALRARQRSPCAESAERESAASPSPRPGNCGGAAKAPGGFSLSPCTRKRSPRSPSGALPGVRKRMAPAGKLAFSQAKKALLAPEGTVRAEGPKDCETAPLHKLMPAEGPMASEAILGHGLVPAEALRRNKAIPLQQKLMPTSTLPRTQLQLMMPAQASANSDATHFTGGQALPMHARVPGVSCPEELSDMGGSLFSGIGASLGASPFQQALYFQPSSILPPTPCSGFEMHGPLSSLRPAAALSIPPQWGLQDVSLAPMPLMPGLAPEVDLLRSCRGTAGMPGNLMPPASSRSTDISGQGLEVDIFGGPFTCTAADIPAAIGFDLGPHQLSAGMRCPSPGPARLAAAWDDEQVADSPYQELLQAFVNDGLHLPEPFVATGNAMTEAFEISGKDRSASNVQQAVMHTHLGGHPEQVGMHGPPGRAPRFPRDTSPGESCSFFNAAPLQITYARAGKRSSDGAMKAVPSTQAPPAPPARQLRSRAKRPCVPM